MASLTPETSLAHYVLDRVAQRLPPGSDVIKNVASVLGLGYHATYRRLSGKAEFRATELVTLSRHFGISLDGYVRPGTYAFQVSALAQPILKSSDFIQRLQGLLSQALQTTGGVLQYATTEVPVFHYLQYPALMSFKLHMWSCTTWQLTSYKQQPFLVEAARRDEALTEQCAAAFALYNALPSEEYWQSSIMDNTLTQIKALHEQGGFGEAGAPQWLLEQMLEMIDYQEDTATRGFKSNKVSLALYHNEMMHTSNVFLLRAPTQARVYFTYDNPNFLGTEHPDFCAHTVGWFDQLKANSLCISVENGRLRRAYFDQLRKRVENIVRLVRS